MYIEAKISNIKKFQCISFSLTVVNLIMLQQLIVIQSPGSHPTQNPAQKKKNVNLQFPYVSFLSFSFP
uniref:Uncharacterized protein n=1 Tax=Rhizophora mucronata TaxID=61149 RepID=A0A2P2PLT1_RHIMU